MSAKLPENMLYVSGEQIVSRATSEFVALLVKKFKVTETDDMQPEEIVRKLLLANLRAHPNEAEIPEGLEDFEALNKFCAGVIESHVDCKNKQTEKEQVEKDARAKEREAEKAKKEAENKEFMQNEQDFLADLTAQVKKSSKTVAKTAQAIVAACKLPSGVAFSGNGMGVVVADGADRSTIAQSVAQVITSFEGIKSAEGALQFMIGDLMNASIAARTFRNKSDAAKALKFAIHDKCGKKFDIGTIQAYALMAERVPVESRQMGIKPSAYLAASKLTLPRLKDAKPAEEQKAQAEVDSFRENAIEKINSGEWDTKTLNDKIKEFKVEKGWVKPEGETVNLTNLYRRYTFANILINEVSNSKDGSVTVKRGKESHTYTLDEVETIRDEAYAALRDALLADYDIAALHRGLTKVTNKKGEKIDVPYFVADPFFTPVKGKKEEEAKKEEETEDTEEEVEETEAEETEDEDEDEDDI